MRAEESLCLLPLPPLLEMRTEGPLCLPPPPSLEMRLPPPPPTSQTSSTPLENHPYPWTMGTGQIFLPKGYPCRSLDMVSVPPAPPSVPHHIHNGWFSCLPPLCTPLHMFEILSFTNIEYIYFIQK